MNEELPAMRAARNSWRCVQAHDREGWLGLMAEDICLEDPIGDALTNPSGLGVRGPAAVAGFYDQHVANSKIVIETHESHAAGNESAHVMSLTTTLPNGVVTKVRTIVTYRVDAVGKITNLRSYWTLSDMEFETPPATT
jgi:steroid delta-isomerase